MPKYFGTDGIRARAGEFPLDSRALFVIGRALGELLNRQLHRPAHGLIGRDTRESGDWIESALTAGLQAAGAVVGSAGVITTPGVAYLTRVAGFDVGIVISASHNPFEDNGIKLFSPSGRKLAEADEESIEAELVAGTLSLDLPPAVQPVLSEALRERYFQFLRDEIGAGLNLNGLKIAVDCANGASAELAPRLFRELGAEVIARGCEPDGRNINEQCGSLHMQNLQTIVREQHCQLGIAFDGDADRALFVDEQGALVDGDRVLFIMAGYYQQRGELEPKQVIATVMSNIGLELALREKGIDLKRTSVGDKYVLDELINSKSLVGGEQSGHIIFPNISLAGDGLITALQVLRVVVSENRSLSALSSAFQTFPQIIVNVPVKSKPAFQSIPAIQSAVAELERELDGQGRLLLRYSGTENLARIMIEGQNQSGITAQAEQLAGVIRQHLG